MVMCSGIVAAAENRIVAEGAERRLVHEGLAEEHRAALAQARDAGRVVPCDAGLARADAGRCRQAGNVDVVLHRQRDAVDRPPECSTPQALIRCARGRTRALHVDANECIQPRIERLDLA
jgi:hypothetical protein